MSCMIWEKELLKLLQQTKEKIGESSEGFIEWFSSLPEVWQGHVYRQLLPRSQGFMPDPEAWVNEAVQAIKGLTLKQRILRGLRASRFAFFIEGSAVRECFDGESLNKWTSENALTYYHEQTTDQYIFSVSPSLAAMRGAREGMRKAAEILRGEG